MYKEIKFEVKNNYGVDRIHPACHISNAMIKLKKGKTFHKADLNVLPPFNLIKAFAMWQMG